MKPKLKTLIRMIVEVNWLDNVTFYANSCENSLNLIQSIKFFSQWTIGIPSFISFPVFIWSDKLKLSPKKRCLHATESYIGYY